MRHVKKLIMIFLMISTIAVCAYAGDLEPPSGEPAPTMHTLEDIYDAVTSGCPICDGAPVPKTGQTTSYETGDDGDLQKGVAIPNPRFTDNGNGTVTDNLTGSIWLKDANAADTSGYDSNGSVDWVNAFDFINKLNNGDYGTDSSGNCGQSDWRLPSVFELESLRNITYFNPCISNTAGTGKWTSGDPFFNVVSSYYWSGTTFAYNTDNAWCVYLNRGNVIHSGKTPSYYVWPVRGGND